MVRPAGSFSSQDAPITIGTSTAISAIITSEMPSTPSENDTPNDGIHSQFTTAWKGLVPPASVRKLR